MSLRYIPKEMAITATRLAARTSNFTAAGMLIAFAQKIVTAYDSGTQRYFRLSQCWRDRTRRNEDGGTRMVPCVPISGEHDELRDMLAHWYQNEHGHKHPTCLSHANCTCVHSFCPTCAPAEDANLLREWLQTCAKEISTIYK